MEHPDDGYPGDEVLQAFAATACLTRFESYVGVPNDESSLGLFPTRPRQLARVRGDHTIGCLVADLGGVMLTGSVRGSGR